jgi:periplasmic divalent cation tolerance protein
MLIVFSTCPDLIEARSLARKIVDARLAACVQVLPEMTSVYYWEQDVQEESEHLLLIKTLPEKWDELKALIIKEHSYTVPEIVGIESSNVSAPYAEWISAYLREL